MGEMMGELVRYLLSLEEEGGRRLVQMGVIQTTIRIMPPGVTVVFDIVPEDGKYAAIYFWHRASPEIIPGVFDWRSQHFGMELLTGPAREASLVEGHDVWLVITRSQPIHTVLTNISGLNQFFETIDFMLLVDSEEDLNKIRAEIQRWNQRSTAGVPGALLEEAQETNRLLRKLTKIPTLQLPPPPVPGRP